MNVELLNDILRRQGLRQCELARAAGHISASRLNAILRGWQKPGKEAEQRIKEGLQRLSVPGSLIGEVFETQSDEPNHGA